MKEPKAFLDFIERANAITILTHLNPDADTLGTALGLYAFLKQQGKRVEVVNYSTVLPQQLDFLPYFEKIKPKSDFAQSLVITCDCGSLDRIGIAVDKQDIINIDHHKSNTHFGTLNIVDVTAVSTSQVAYSLLKEVGEVNSETALCFYTALASDTNFFTTPNVTAVTFSIAQELLFLGANASEVAHNLTQRKSLASFRILQMSLETLRLYNEATVGVVISTAQDIKASGATSPDLDGIVSHVRSLATVKIAVHLMEGKGVYRASFRSKQADVSRLAKAFDGGGHKLAAGCTLPLGEIEDTVGTILQTIYDLGLLHETTQK